MNMNDIENFRIVICPDLHSTVWLKTSFFVKLYRFKLNTAHSSIFDGQNLIGAWFLNNFILLKQLIRRVEAKSSWQNLLENTFLLAVYIHHGKFNRKDVVVTQELSSPLDLLFGLQNIVIVIKLLNTQSF